MLMLTLMLMFKLVLILMLMLMLTFLVISPRLKFFSLPFVDCLFESHQNLTNVQLCSSQIESFLGENFWGENCFLLKYFWGDNFLGGNF